MSNFKVGDKVKMSEAGRAKYPDEFCNPHNVIGEVFLLKEKGMTCRVRWENNCTNAYYPEHLELAEESLEDLFRKEIENKVEDFVSSFKVLELGVDFVDCGDFFITEEDGIFYTYESDNLQKEPDIDNEWSSVVDYISNDAVVGAFRSSFVGEFSQEFLKAVVEASAPAPKEPVEISTEDLKVIQEFAGPSTKTGEQLVNKIRKTRNTEIQPLLSVLDKLL